MNPDDKQSPIAFNPLSVDDDEDIEQKVDDFVTIFKRAVGDTGFRMDQILSETLYALIRRPGSTLDDIEKFLSRSNPAFRNEVLRTADEKTRTFFEDTYPTMDRNAANPVLSRISAFTRREAVRNILCQTGKSFSFRRAMNEGKIIIFQRVRWDFRRTGKPTVRTDHRFQNAACGNVTCQNPQKQKKSLLSLS